MCVYCHCSFKWYTFNGLKLPCNAIEETERKRTFSILPKKEIFVLFSFCFVFFSASLSFCLFLAMLQSLSHNLFAFECYCFFSPRSFWSKLWQNDQTQCIAHNLYCYLILTFTFSSVFQPTRNVIGFFSVFTLFQINFFQIILYYYVYEKNRVKEIEKMQVNIVKCSHVFIENMINFDDKWSGDKRIQIRKHHDMLININVVCVLLTFDQSVVFSCCTFTAVWKYLWFISTKDNFVNMCQLWEIVIAWQLIYLHCQYYKLLHKISFK